MLIAQTGETLPATMIERLNRSAVLGRAGWIRSQLQRASFALKIHRTAGDRNDIDERYQAILRAMSDHAPLRDTHGYPASPHLTGYGPNYYMYLLDKVIAVDFAARFPANDPRAGAAALEYRRDVLEPGATRSATTLVRSFLGRPERVEALVAWMEGTPRRETPLERRTKATG